MEKLKSCARQVVMGLFAVMAVVVVGCGKKAAGGGADIAVIQDADLVVHADLDAMRGAAIYAKLKELADKQNEKSDAQAKKMKDLGEELKKITGLEDEDFQAITVSAVLDGVDMEAKAYADVADTLNGVMAVQLAKAVTLDQIEEAIQAAADDDPDMTVAMSRENYKNDEILVVNAKESADAKESPFAVAMANDNKTIVAGTMIGTKGALDRAGGKAESAVAALDLDEESPAQFAMRLNLTEEMRNQLKENAKQQAGQTGNPQAAMAQSFADLEKVSAAVNMADSMDVSLAMALGSEESATAAKGMIDTNVLGMARMMISMMSGGQPTTLGQSLKTVADPDGSVVLSFTLSSEDLDLIKKMSEQQGAPAGGMPGGTTPMPPQPMPGN